MKKLYILLLLAIMSVVNVCADTVTDPLIFTATTASTVGISNVGGNSPDVRYSVDGGAWTQFTSGTKVSIPKGKQMKVFGYNESGFSQSTTKYTKFVMTGSVAASGNVMSLIDGGKATTIPNDNCFTYLFNGCTSMTSAPALPATTLKKACYYDMFYRCTALTNAPELPATTLAIDCYNGMFSGCTALTSAPALPATSLANYCYYNMFNGCKSLVNTPELPATTLSFGCYLGMFQGCTTLTSAPALPATTLANNCYLSMFKNCTSLTKAPELPATALKSYCYNGMFSGCTNLKYLKVAFTNWNVSYATTDWVKGVACNGVFECPKTLDVSTFSTSRVPLSTDCPWTIVTDPLIFTATTASTVGISNVGGNSPDVWYSVDGGDWTQFTSGTQVSIPKGKQMRVFGYNESGFSQSTTKYTKFVMTGSVAASGNVMALIDGGKATTIPNDNCFTYLFNGCTSMTSAPALPATTLKMYCYYNMFYRCTALTNAPELPATTLIKDCYNGMFSGCTALTSAPALPATTLANYCYYTMFQGCTSLVNTPELPVTTLAYACYNSMFYGCTSLTNAPELPATTLATYCYNSMFYGCTSLTKAPELPATTLTSYCYNGMFSGCTNLKYLKVAFTNWNVSSATSNWVKGVACNGVFECPKALDVSTFSTSRVPRDTDCKWTVVTDPLIFTATAASTVGISNVGGNSPDVWYSVDGGAWTQFTSGTKVSIPKGKQMKVFGYNESGFSQSTTKYTKFVMTGSVAASGNVMSLIDGGKATTIPNDNCFTYLFNGCTSMTSAPALPATTLKKACYYDMFYRCTALTNAPELPATTLAIDCYNGMFSGCTALTSAPALPATSLANYCYYNMFNGCKSLVNTPELPATTLSFGCYLGMFQGCTALTSAPALSATTLANNCYLSMFKNCTSLTKAPELPATTLTSYCYNGMFSGCTNLNYLNVAFTDWNVSNATTDWVKGVACNGVFECPKTLDVSTFSTSRVPLSTDCKWLTVTDPLIFTATTASTVGISNVGGNAPDVWYSVDGGDWTQFTSGTQVSIPQGKQMRVAGRNESGFSQSSSKYTKFVMTGSVAASGNVMALIDGGTATTIPNNYCFYNLFNGCTVMTSSPTLPSTTLTEHCYEGMFYECTALTNAPLLPATTLAESCYCQMFEGCTSLATAPALPATTMASHCYSNMFNGCTKINPAADYLKGTTLANGCYESMFDGCSALTNVLELPVTTLYSNCYQRMFAGCTALTKASELPATTLANNCYQGMFNGCTALTKAPELPATTLTANCYNGMFNGCTALNYLKVAFTDWNVSGATTDWVKDVACNGTFECPDALDVSTFSTSRVPRDTECPWLVQVKNVSLNNTTYYRNIQDAYSTAVDGDEIEILEDIPTQSLTTSGKSINIDGGGHTMKNMAVGKNAIIRLVGNMTIGGEFSVEAVKNGDTGATESGSYYEDGGTLTLDGDAYFDLILKEGEGKVNDKVWYNFCLPFKVSTSDGIYCVLDNGTVQQGVNNKNYMLRSYSGTVRSESGAGWQKELPDNLEAGKFYMLGTNGIKHYRFKKKSGEPLVSSATITLEEYASSRARNAGWNAIGNTTLYNTTLTGDGVNFVQTYSDSEKKYNIALISGTQFSVGTPYFVQFAKGMSTITQNYADAGGNKSAEIQEPQYYEVCIAPAGSDKFADRMYIAASTDALDEYEPGKDVMNLTSGTPAGTQCWIRAYESKLSACYAPLVDFKAEFNADFFVTKAGNYSIYIEKEVNDGSTIYVTENGEKIWNLNESAFETALHKGENSQYGLLIEVDEDAIFTAADYTTDSGKVVTADNGIIRICNLEQGDLYVIYDIDGKTLASGYADDDCVETLTAPNGTAVVRINDEIIKILR